MMMLVIALACGWSCLLPLLGQCALYCSVHGIYRPRILPPGFVILVTSLPLSVEGAWRNIYFYFRETTLGVKLLDGDQH